METKKILYWSDEKNPNNFVGKAKNEDPRKVGVVISELKQGVILEQYLGFAECRICPTRRLLSGACLTGYGYRWPARAEHYIIDHGVWLPELDEFYHAVQNKGTK